MCSIYLGSFCIGFDWLAAERFVALCVCNFDWVATGFLAWAFCPFAAGVGFFVALGLGFGTKEKTTSTPADTRLLNTSIDLMSL